MNKSKDYIQIESRRLHKSCWRISHIGSSCRNSCYTRLKPAMEGWRQGEDTREKNKLSRDRG